MVTHNKSKPAFFLTAERIGHWIGLDETGLLKDQAAREELIQVFEQAHRLNFAALVQGKQMFA